jgi:hypothetical protein
VVQAFGRKEYNGCLNWISPGNTENSQGYSFRVRRKFNANEIDPAGKLVIAAESYYALYLNGTLLGVGPARGTRTCSFLDTYDLSSYLKPGENHLAVEVFCNTVPTYIADPAEPAVFVQSGRLTTDETWEVQKSPDYRTEDVPLYTLQIGLMQWQDSRKTPRGWETFQDDTLWQKAQVIPRSAKLYTKKLFYRDVAMLRQQCIAPVKVSAVYEVDKLADPEQTNVADILTEEKYFPCSQNLMSLITENQARIDPPGEHNGVVIILDMGVEFIGGFRLDLDAPEGTILDVGYQEIIEGDRLNLNPSFYDFADRFILAEGKQTVDNPVHYRGGRFMQLVFRNFDRPITIHHFAVIDRRYPIDAPATFTCDSQDYNEIWNRCFNTLSACAVDTFIDCPWREMSFWVNDFLVVNTFWLKMVGLPDLSRRSLALAISQRQDDGLIFGVCPDGLQRNKLFPTNLFLSIVLKEILLHAGDRKLVSNVLDELADIVTCCEKFSDNTGLLSPPSDYWNFVDWSYYFFKDIALDGKTACVVNLFYVHALQALADLYQLTDPAKSQHYTTRAKEVLKKIEHHFWDAEQQGFIEWIPKAEEKPLKAGKLVQSLALLTGMLSPALETQVKQDLPSDEGLLPELYMMHFYFQALAKIGRHDKIHRLIETYWSPMLKTDCPTIWEANVYGTAKKAFDNGGSLCHAFSLAPIACFQEYVLGIAPLTDGFETFTFTPIPGELQNAAGSVITPHGQIKAEWIASDQTIQVKITVPENTTCRLPNGQILTAGTHKLQLERSD